MVRIKSALIGLVALLAISPALAQVPNFPQTLPKNTVVGRLGVSAGPSQAIPFALFTTNLLGSLGGTNGQVFLGVTGGPAVMATMSQDCTITNAGVVTCLKTNNVAFTALATQAIPCLVTQGCTGLIVGTSGGIPYFSSTTAMASSALLTAKAVMVGGGAGATPSTIAAGVDGQIMAGVTGANPAFVGMSRDCTISNAGVITCLKTNNVSFTSLATAAVGQIPGETSTGSASAGNVGEYISSSIASGSAVSLTTATPANITSISLTAGDWDVSGSGSFTGGATTTVAFCDSDLSTVSATIDVTPERRNTQDYYNVAVFATLNPAQPTGPSRFSLSTTTTIFLVARCNFATSTAAGYGTIRARRMR